MSHKSVKSRSDKKVDTGNQNTTKPLPEEQHSPLMFDEDIFTAEDYSHNRPTAANHIMSTQKSSTNWISPENRSNTNSPAVVLSMSQVEHVTTCWQCDQMGLLNESTENIENHNRSISDIVQTTMHVDDEMADSGTGISSKRARLNELTDIVKDASASTKPCDFRKLIEVQSKVISDRLASLHEDK